jgi:chitinase
VTGANTAQLSVNVAEVTVSEQYNFTLTVTDNEGATDSATVTLTVNPVDTTPGNTAPVAAITGSTMANANDLVALDASSSSDKENDPLSFTWETPAGLVVATNGAQVSFTAPSISVDTDYLFTVVVSDGSLTSSQSHTVTVKADSVGTTCAAPWDPTAVYNGGQEVTYQGHVYSAKWWTQGEEPSKSGEWGVWKDLGPCQ